LARRELDSRLRRKKETEGAEEERVARVLKERRKEREKRREKERKSDKHFMKVSITFGQYFIVICT